MFKPTSEDNRQNQILEGVCHVLKTQFKPHQIILFGSRAKGSASERSDFDFAVDVLPSPVHRQQVEEMIAGVAGLYEVDVVYLPEVDESFRKLILETGKVLYQHAA